MNGVRKKLLPKKSNHCSNTLSHRRMKIIGKIFKGSEDDKY